MTNLNVSDVAKALHKKFKRGNFADPAAWAGRCYEVASAMVQAKIVVGTPVYGHWLGPVHRYSSFYGRPIVRHGWVLQADDTMVDPTRWVFENSPPYIWSGKELNHPSCDDFEGGEDDPFMDECVHCGHDRSEHRTGFFCPCTNPACRWPYDEGGNQLMAAQFKSRPWPKEPASKKVPLPVTGEKARMVLKTLLGANLPTRSPTGYPFTIAQLFWIAAVPYEMFNGQAKSIYRAFKRIGRLTMIPLDNQRRAERE